MQKNKNSTQIVMREICRIIIQYLSFMSTYCLYDKSGITVITILIAPVQRHAGRGFTYWGQLWLYIYLKLPLLNRTIKVLQ